MGERGACENRNKRNPKMRNYLLTALALMLAPVAAFAQLDVTSATGAITDGQTAVIVVITALVVAYGAFLGWRMVLARVKRG